MFREGLKRGPETARLHNDLGVAYLRQGEPYSRIRALDSFGRALEIDRDLPEALFNRALVLSELGLERQGLEAWRLYLHHEPVSPWSGAARGQWLALRDVRRLAVREDRIRESVRAEDWASLVRAASREPQAVRAAVEEILLPAWARAVRSREVERTEDLERALAEVSRALSARTGDLLLLETAVENARASEPRLRSLALGYLRYAEGCELARGQRPREAKRLFEEAWEALSRGRGPFAHWARFRLAVSAYHERDYAAALRLAVELCETARRRSYLTLGARAAWLTGLIETERSRPEAAVQSLREALAGFSAAGETANQAFVHTLISSAYEYMAERREAWEHRYFALRTTCRAGDRQRLPVILGEAAKAASREGLHRAALTLQNEAVALTRDGDALARSEALWWRGEVLHRAGRPAAALRDVAAARRACREIPDVNIRAHTLAGLASLEGAIRRFRAPAAAVTLLSEALSYSSRQSFRFPLIELYLHRGQSFAALGDFERAERDFLAGIAEYEGQRELVGDLYLRLRYFEQAKAIFDEAIRVRLQRRGDWEGACDLAERARARLLWDAMGSLQGGRSPLSCQEVRGGLPAGAALVGYYDLPDSLLVWVVDRRSVQGRRLPVSPSTLRERVTALQKVAAAGGKDFHLRASLLYGELLEPVAPLLSGRSRLIFVPSGDLDAVPFAALLNPRSGRFLVEDHEVLVAPSASSHLWAADRVRSSPAAGSAVTGLMVGNPAFDRKRHRGLPSLRESQAEALRVAALFPGSVLLLRERATPEGVLERLGEHELFFYGGHAVMDGERPFLSKLLLARSQEHEGEIEAREIHSLRLKDTRLAVLSACATGSGARAALEGSTHLARSFLAAGIPSVVASLWNVPDAKVGPLIDRFFDEIRKGRDAAAALRAAQLACLRSPDPRVRHASVWGGFELFGAAPVLVAR